MSPILLVPPVKTNICSASTAPLAETNICSMSSLLTAPLAETNICSASSQLTIPPDKYQIYIFLKRDSSSIQPIYRMVTKDRKSFWSRSTNSRGTERFPSISVVGEYAERYMLIKRICRNLFRVFVIFPNMRKGHKHILFLRRKDISVFSKKVCTILPYLFISTTKTKNILGHLSVWYISFNDWKNHFTLMSL